MEEKEKIDVNGENETIESKIEKFCSVLMKMPIFFVRAMVDEETNLKLVESEIIRNLFSDLEKKNKFVVDNEYVYEKFAYYAAALLARAQGKQQEFLEKYSNSADGVINKPPFVSADNIPFTEMTNREFLKKFIKQMIDLNKLFRAEPKWKRISSIFLTFVVGMSGIKSLIIGILAGSKLVCFLSFLVMCAWAGLICSLVFHLSLAVLIPSAIVLGFTTIFCLYGIVKLQMMIYKTRQEKVTDIDDFFNLVDEINQYLDTHDLPPEKISSGKENSKKPSIKEKIKNANENKENNVTTEENDDKKSEKSKNK